MKWAIYNPKTMKYVHPGIYKDPQSTLEWNIIEWDSLPYFFDDIYDIEMYLCGKSIYSR